MSAMIHHLNKFTNTKFDFSEINETNLERIFYQIDSKRNEFRKESSFQYLKIALIEMLQNIQEHSSFENKNKNISFSTFYSKYDSRSYINFVLQDNAAAFLNFQNIAKFANKLENNCKFPVRGGRGQGLAFALKPVLFDGDSFQLSSGRFELSVSRGENELVVSKNTKSNSERNEYHWQVSLCSSSFSKEVVCA